MKVSEIQKLDLKDKRTVFVLGAGASKPYGFPLGEELKTTIIGRLTDHNCITTLVTNGFRETLVRDFAEALTGTYSPTIDIFLEKKGKFRTLGAYMIAYVLFPCENHRLLFPQNNWYAQMYNILGFERDFPDTSRISFVTFNYERSLEHFLAKNVLYNCPDDKMDVAESKLENLSIIHAHGSLGRYPDVPFGKGLDTKLVGPAAEGIRIVSDRLEDSSDFNAAKQSVLSADNIVFIGFGYDPVTMKKLIMNPRDFDEKRLLGTSVNLSESSRAFLKEYFSGKFEMPEDSINAEQLMRIISH